MNVSGNGYLLAKFRPQSFGKLGAIDDHAFVDSGANLLGAVGIVRMERPL